MNTNPTPPGQQYQDHTLLSESSSDNGIIKSNNMNGSNSFGISLNDSFQQQLVQAVQNNGINEHMSCHGQNLPNNESVLALQNQFMLSNSNTGAVEDDNQKNNENNFSSFNNNNNPNDKNNNFMMMMNSMPFGGPGNNSTDSSNLNCAFSNEPRGFDFSSFINANGTNMSLSDQNSNNNIMNNPAAMMFLNQALSMQQQLNQQQNPSNDPDNSINTNDQLCSSQIQPTYVNAKQYNRIIKRREARQIIQKYYSNFRSENSNGTNPATTSIAYNTKKTQNMNNNNHSSTTTNDNSNSDTVCGGKRNLDQIEKSVGIRKDNIIDKDDISSNASGSRKPYSYESRHRHAMKRPRGPGGRFLTKEELDEFYKSNPTQQQGDSNIATNSIGSKNIVCE